jgi:kynureninase
MTIAYADVTAMDAHDTLAHARGRFFVPDNVIYLDGNSLGALPRSALPRLVHVVDKEWGDDLIRSWNKNDWIGLPARLGVRLSPLLGAAPDEVIVADSTSVNLFKLAAAAVRLKSPRRVILTEQSNFPTDLYVLQGLEEMLGGAVTLRMVARDELEQSLQDDVALLALTHGDFRTGEIHDMRRLTQAAHVVGALALWDLSHSAGAMELLLNGDDVDLGIGCGYKYLNGGPGAPAFMFVARRHQASLRQPLSGWMGHASPFDFTDCYRPADGIARMLCGTPAVLSMAALEEGLKTFDGIDMCRVREKSVALGDLFLDLVESRCADSGFAIASPRDSHRRGSQISLKHPEGYAIMQALIEQGVIGDFRAPDILRFGFAPLYTRYVDAWNAAERLASIMAGETWRQERFHTRAMVT